MPKAYESPLLSHARTLAMLHATIELRVLQGQLDRSLGLRKGLEACWVGSAIGLEDHDLSGSGPGNALVEYVRARGQGTTARAAVRKLLAVQPTPLPAAPVERLHLQLGMALALKRQAAGAVLAFCLRDDLDAPAWTRLFKLALVTAPPLVLVVLPARRQTATIDLSRLAARAAASSGAWLPVIPVDAGDPIALYRVTQESLGRARTDGGLVAIDCVPTGTDPVELLSRQAMAKGLLSTDRVARIQPAFRGLLERA